MTSTTLQNILITLGLRLSSFRDGDGNFSFVAELPTIRFTDDTLDKVVIRAIKFNIAGLNKELKRRKEDISIFQEKRSVLQSLLDEAGGEIENETIGE